MSQSGEEQRAAGPGQQAARKPRRWRRLIRIAVILVAIVVVFIFGVAPYLLSVLVTSAGTRAMDRKLTSTPGDYNVTFEDVEFATTDGIKISAWLIPSRGKDATIVYAHGLLRSRRELLERAIELCKKGYGALLIDERNHGSSGKARTSLGFHERLDVEAAVRFLRDTRQTNDRIVLLGVSMGATACLLAAAETPDVAGVVSDSAFLSFDHTIDHHVRLFFRLPPFPIANEIKFYIQERAAFNGGDLDSLGAVRRIERPILFIAGAHDRRMPPEIAETLYASAIDPRKDLLIVDGPGAQIHGHSYQAAPDVYLERVSQFLGLVLTGPVRQGKDVSR
jgi:pimeloyl-ACP methyl ester carboxylesterase